MSILSLLKVCKYDKEYNTYNLVKILWHFLESSLKWDLPLGPPLEDFFPQLSLHMQEIASILGPAPNPLCIPVYSASNGHSAYNGHSYAFAIRK